MMQKNHVAIIDIGSNAVRLVVFNELNRAPIKLHAERDICGLGKGLQETGHLNPDGVKRALDSLARFSGILSAMRITNVRAVATAAMRDASDGPDFMAKVRDEFGLEIEVITGEDEARLSAMGVIASHGKITGIIGDFGGGSLELAAVEEGKIQEHVTLPLGALRILSHKTFEARAAYIQEHLATTDILKKYRKHPLYILGGAWRTLAKAHMYMEDYPVFILDHYKISGAKAAQFAGELSKRTEKSLEEMAGVIKRRASDMPAGAQVLNAVLSDLKPKELIFTATGLREGLLYEQLAPATRAMDPLLASCRDIALKTSRFADDKELLALGKWLMPLFEEQGEANEDFERLVKAAALLSDFGWYEHEDHRANHAFLRILRLPLYGLDHKARAMMALAVYVRYRGYLRQSRRTMSDMREVTKDAQAILTQKEINQAVTIGLALELAYSLTAGALNLLPKVDLSVSSDAVTLCFAGRTAAMRGDIVKGKLEALAKRVKRKAEITEENP